MIFNKDRSTKYLGFHDQWFAIIGIFILSLIIDFQFNNSFGRLPFKDALINWSISLFFTVINWLLMREIMMRLRKWFPGYKETLKRIAILFCLVVITLLVVDYFGNLILNKIYGNDYHPKGRAQILVPIASLSIMVQGFYEAIYYFIQLQNSLHEKEAVEKLNLQIQLDALRNQSQPHFLFNALNTLKDIIEFNDTDDAKKFVDKLADVYRFILETKDDNLISLRDELKFAKAYMHIQKERFLDNLQISWNISDESLDLFTVPMSIQILLENAIKHNVVSKAKPLNIKVEIKDKHVIITNPIQMKSSQVKSTKLGLRNLEKRFEIISGKEIIVNQENEIFFVSVPLLDSSYNTSIT